MQQEAHEWTHEERAFLRRGQTWMQAIEGRRVEHELGPRYAVAGRAAMIPPQHRSEEAQALVSDTRERARQRDDDRGR